MTDQTSRRRPQRRWHEAPVILHGPETLEGGRVLDEVEGPLGLLLWQLLRDVVLWANAGEDGDRGRLFGSSAPGQLARLDARATCNGQLGAAVGALARVVRDPISASAPPTATACLLVAQWAEAADHTATALEFTQAAALADPADAGAPLAVSRLARRLGEHARAETWLRRAVTMARRSGDWGAYAQALYQLGSLYRDRGYRRTARRFFIRSLRASVRRGETATRAAATRALRELA